MTQHSPEALSKLQKRIGYNFKKIEYLRQAVTHSSYANEKRSEGLCDNERLEFLGDSVLGMVTASYLFEKYADTTEGELTKMRSSLVCEGALCERAKSIDLGAYLLLGNGEESGGGRKRASILADAFEALIGAIYLDSGEPAARSFITRFVLSADGKADKVVTDYKTMLQEIVQKNKGEQLSYHMLSANGPDHERSFSIEVRLNSNVIGKGEGHSKKEAEQAAAREAIKLMGLE